MKKVILGILGFGLAVYAFAGDEVFFEPIGPWTPLEVDQANHTVRVTGREYIFGNSSLMPIQMVSNEQNLFTNGCGLNITANGVILKPSNIKIEYGEASRTSATLRVSGRYTGGNVTLGVSADYLFEFDGFVWVDLKISKPVQPGVVIDKVEFSARFSPAVAKKLSYARTRYYRAERKDFAGVINLDEKPAWQAEQFRPFITIANETVGLTWFAETRRDWQGEKNQYFSTENGNRMLGVKFINKPTGLEKDFEVGFGLMALPIRKLDAKYFRKVEYVGQLYDKRASPATDYKPLEIDRLAKMGVRHLIQSFWGRFSHPEPFSPDKFKVLLREMEKEGICYYPYYGSSAANRNTPFIEKNFERFAIRPLRGNSGASNPITSYTYLCLNSKEYQDYLLASIQKLVDEYGIKNLYTDTCKVYECNSSFHGCGDGDDIISYPIRAARRVTKGYYRILKTADPANVYIYHRSGFAIHAPYDGFADVRLTGERMTIDYIRKEFIVDEKWLSALRMTHTPALEGIPVLWIDRGNRNPHFSLVQGMALKTLHEVGSLGTTYYFYKKSLDNTPPELMEVYQVFHKVDEVYKQFGTETAQWHGYHQDNSAVRMDVENPKTLIKCSYYSKKGKRVLLILANLSRTPSEAQIHIDLEKLGLDNKKLACFDHLTNQSLPLNGNTLSLSFGDTKKQGSFYLVELSTEPIHPTEGTFAEIEKTSWWGENKEIHKITIRDRLPFEKKVVSFNFSEVSGTRVTSEQLNVRGTVKNYAVDRKEDGLLFNGTNSYLSIDKNIDAKLGTKTELGIEMEFKCLSFGKGTLQQLLYKGGTYQVMLDETRRLSFGIKLDGQWIYVRSRMKFTEETWYRCSFTFDRNFLEIYNDGVKIASKQANGDILPNNYPLIVGANHTGARMFFNGHIKRLAVMNKALGYESD